jgi:hypothetical protein
LRVSAVVISITVRLLVRDVVAVLLLAIAAAGCAGPTYRGEEQHTESPRVRCLSDARGDTAAGTRPLFFFFCLEAP